VPSGMAASRGGRNCAGSPVAVLLALAALALLVAAAAAGLRRGALTVRGLVGGVLAFPLVTLLTTVVAFLGWSALKASVPELGVITLGTDQNAFFVFGLVAFALAAFSALYTPLLRRARMENLALGALAWWVMVSVTFALVAPSAAYMWTLPALAATGVALWRISGEHFGAWSWAAGVGFPLAVLIVVYAPVMLIFTVLAFRLDGLGFPAVGIMGLFTALAGGLLVPHLAPRLAGQRALLGSCWLAPVAVAALAVVLVAVGVARLGYDQSYPRADFVSYVLDADSGRAAWAAGDRESWTEPLLRNAREADVQLAPFSTFSGWRAPAPVVDLPGPEFERVSASSGGNTVSVRLRLRSARGADNLATEFRASGPILAASVEGRELPRTAERRDGGLKLPYVGLPDDGITVVLEFRGGGTLRARMSDWTQGLPDELEVAERPADTMPPAPSFRADPTIVVSEATLRYGG
jgi:hypothetical protein